MFRTLITLSTAVLLSTASAGPVQASSTELDAKVRGSMERLYSAIPGGAELAGKAVGILVFPRVYRAGFWFGGGAGEGALLVDGQIVQYYRTTSLSFGLQFGGQGRTEIILFMTQTALAQFRASRGWQAGIDGSIAFVEFGAGTALDTDNIRDPIIGFMFDNKGLMADLSFRGNKFWRITK